MNFVRLSSWIYFVDHKTHWSVHNTIDGSRWDVALPEMAMLRQYARFRPATDDAVPWVARGVLVAPGSEVLVPRGSQAAEAAANAAWTKWYWQTEAESERDYRWLGEPLLKMPDDLFMYQELMHANRARSVLEIGYGGGGSLWFFGHILQSLGGGQVVGVDWDPPGRIPAYERLHGVSVARVHSDAHSPRTVEEVRAIRSSFDLVVIDADPSVDGKLELLRAWAPLVAPRGSIVLEDVTTPECVEQDARVSIELDRFLLNNSDFGVMVRARRFPVGKAMRAACTKAF